MGLDQVSAGRSVPEDFNVVIEIPMNADQIKYEVDKDSGALFVDRFIGTDVSLGLEYRPLLSENVSFMLGLSGLIAGQGAGESPKHGNVARDCGGDGHATPILARNNLARPVSNTETRIRFHGNGTNSAEARSQCRWCANPRGRRSVARAATRRAVVVGTTGEPDRREGIGLREWGPATRPSRLRKRR